METIAGQLLLGCWIVFVLYWIVGARRVRAIAEKQRWTSALAHGLPLGFSYFLLAFRRFPPLLDRPVTPSAASTLALGALICLLGLFFTLWARWTLAGNWSSAVTFKQGHELIRTGPCQSAYQKQVKALAPFLI